MNRLFNFIREMSLRGRRRRGKKSFALLFGQFQRVLELNNCVLASIASLHNKLGGDYVFDIQYLRSATQELGNYVRKLIDALDAMVPGKFQTLYRALRAINTNIENELAGRPAIPDILVIPFNKIEQKDINVVGGKSTRLALIKRTLDLRVPDGFAVTTRAYLEFMEFNGIDELVSGFERDWRAGVIPLNEASEKIRTLILSGVLPTRLRRALNKATDALVNNFDDKKNGLAVRSSAWGEDGDHSFAGQYASLLNVFPSTLHDAYIQILASTYSASAMEYRREHGYKVSEILMAVSVQAMIPAKTSGVVYTLSPLSPEDNSLIIVATLGLGSPVVAGTAEVDRFVMSREPEHEQISISIVRKEQAEQCSLSGGVSIKAMPEDIQTKACLTSKEIQLLIKAALRIEQYFKKPQDIEFAFDQAGDLVILQSRPLHVQVSDKNISSDLSKQLQNYTVLLSGKGDVAQQGVGSGPVFVVRENRSLDDFPDGAILVAGQSSPQYASILHRSSGVITDIGSPLGHMATIAREYHVPALLNVGNATEVLKDGEVITLDAEQKTVYLGEVKELNLHEVMRGCIDETYEYRLLRRLLKHIEPLNLFDPSARNFTPQGCLSLHDITRFIHEKAVEVLVNIPNMVKLEPSCPGGRLKLPIPLDMVVLDIGGGLTPDIDKATASPDPQRGIELEQITFAPMHAFIEGVTMPGVWQSSPVPVDFSSFMSSMTRTFSSDMVGASSVGQNLAVLSNNYVHLSLRLGYHFTMIDCYVSDNPGDNYVYFRFTGGVTSVARRSRRAKFLAEILSESDFSVTTQDDLVVARAKKHTAQEVLRPMRILGILVAYTRQLDVAMVNDAQIQKHSEEFGKLIKR